MKILLVTDTWLPQVNGVVTTLVQLAQALEHAGNVVEVIHPGMFETRPCPGYPGIALARRPGKALGDMVQAAKPEAIHLATEGPLGWAMRRYCRKHRLAFTTGYHVRLPELLKARFRVPLWAGYAVLRYFHSASSGVLVPASRLLRDLHSRGFQRLRSWTLGVDTAALTYRESPEVYPPLGALARPVSLYVGRLHQEKTSKTS